MNTLITINILIAHEKERRSLPPPMEWTVFGLSQGMVNLLAFAASGLGVDMWSSSIQWGIKGRLMGEEIFWEEFCCLV